MALRWPFDDHRQRPLLADGAIGLVVVCLETLPRQSDNLKPWSAGDDDNEMAADEDINEAARAAGLTPERLLRQILADASDALIVVDSEQRVLLFNAAAEDLFGYPAAEVLGGSLTELLPERYRRAHPGHVEKFAHEGTSRRRMSERAELVGLRRDGTEVPVEVTISRLETGDQVLLTGLVRDVTARRALEATQERMARRFEAMVENASDAIAVLGPDGRATYLSPSFFGLLGYPVSALRDWKCLDLIHPDHQLRWQRVMQRVVACPNRTTREELLVRHRDDRWRWLETTFTNLLDRPEVAGIVLNARDITQRKDAEEALVHQAAHDALTGLPNRLLLSDRIRQALLAADSFTSRPAVLFVDIDRFKLVNDSLGHGAGDELLVATAARIKSAVREVDTVARLGGDEFVLVCPGLGCDGAVLVAERVLAAVAPAMTVSNTDLFVTASVGIALAENRTVSPDRLLADADVAMYEAKARGGNCYELFRSSLRERSIERVHLEADLRRALSSREIVPRYQPLIALHTGEVVAFEALARWAHPTRGLLSPEGFIQLAEETGLDSRPRPDDAGTGLHGNRASEFGVQKTSSALGQSLCARVGRSGSHRLGRVSASDERTSSRVTHPRNHREPVHGGHS